MFQDAEWSEFLRPNPVGTGLLERAGLAEPEEFDPEAPGARDDDELCGALGARADAKRRSDEDEEEFEDEDVEEDEEFEEEDEVDEDFDEEEFEEDEDLDEDVEEDLGEEEDM